MGTADDSVDSVTYPCSRPFQVTKPWGTSPVWPQAARSTYVRSANGLHHVLGINPTVNDPEVLGVTEAAELLWLRVIRVTIVLSWNAQKPQTWGSRFSLLPRWLLFSSSEPGFAGSFARLACATRLTLVVLLDKSFGDEGRIVALIAYTEVVVYRQANPVRGVTNSAHPAVAPGAW